MPAKATKKSTPEQTPQKFYGDALSEAEQIDFQSALKVQGIDQEIAVLRMRLRSAIAGRTIEFGLLLRGIDMLVKAVVAKYKLAPGSDELLRHSLSQVIRELENIKGGRKDGE